MDDAAEHEIALTVDGMSCGHCQQAVEDALAEIRGVDRVEVSLDAGTATIASDGAVDADTLVDAVETAGYEARPR